MSKLVQRLLVFFIGVPLVLSMVFVDYSNHLILHIAMIVVTIIASLEMYGLLAVHNSMQPRMLVITLTVLLPITGFLCAFLSLPFDLLTYTLIFILLLILLYEVLFPRVKDEEPFALSNSRISSSFLLVIYSGFLITFVARMTVWANSTAYLSVFLAMVFGCDSFAWLIGMLFGKGNRGLFLVSPNKSIAGFAGGVLGTIGIGILAWNIFPQAFPGSVYKVVILGLIASVSAIFGDLIESVLKRSAHYKDSGKVIPGRGGILDSIDSILLLSPVYFIAIQLLYGI
ncbi:MAG TPA: CDP-archaeol synthase [Treponemataceae bacterium]|nr:CDP-archaeol synthase [Treponemataceae bacterium]